MDQPRAAAGSGTTRSLAGRLSSRSAYQASSTPPAAKTMSPGTRSQTSVSITFEWMISGERAYHRPRSMLAAAW